VCWIVSYLLTVMSTTTAYPVSSAWINGYDATYYSILFCCMAAAGLGMIVVGALCWSGKKDLTVIVKSLFFWSAIALGLVLNVGQLAASIILAWNQHFSGQFWWNVDTTVPVDEWRANHGGDAVFGLSIISLVLSFIVALVAYFVARAQIRKEPLYPENPIPGEWAVRGYLITFSLIQLAILIAGIIIISEYTNQQDAFISNGSVATLSAAQQVVFLSRFREAHWIIVACAIAVPLVVFVNNFCAYTSNPFSNPGPEFYEYDDYYYDPYYHPYYYYDDNEQEE